jgi:hypothetical protein
MSTLSAIAIPNFIRYQVRAKASEVPLVLGALVNGEAALVVVRAAVRSLG